MKKKTLYVLAIILGLLVITNPSQKAFKEYLGVSSYRGLRRTSNFLLFSIYSDGDKYFAILGNFFEFHSDPFIPYGGHELTQEETDSVEMVDSAKIKMDSALLPPPPAKKIIGYEKSGLPVYDPDPLHIIADKQYDDLYIKLYKHGYNLTNLGTFEEFCDNVKVRKKAIKLYAVLIKEGLTENDLGTKDEFIKTFCK